MARKRSKSSLSKKLGTAGRKAFDAVKGEEARFSSAGELPAGIEGGVAKLVDCKFGIVDESKANAGEYYFYAAGIVQSPKKVKDADGNISHVEGLRTSIMEMLCETPGRSRESIEDHIDWVANEFKKLGVDLSDVDFDEWESLAEELKEAKPRFKFRTWKGTPTEQYPDPRVNHQWNGLIEDDDEDDDIEEDDDVEEDEVEDDVEEDEDEDEAEDEVEDEVEDDEDDEIDPEKEEIYFYKPPRKRKRVECELTGVLKGKKTVTLKEVESGKVHKGVPFDSLSYDPD